MSSFQLALAAATVVLFYHTDNVVAADEVTDSLSRRRSTTSTIHYRLKGTRFTPHNASPSGRVMSEEHTGSLESTFKIDFDNNWVFQERIMDEYNASTRKYAISHVQLFFDGSTLRHFFPTMAEERRTEGYSEQNPDLGVKNLATDERMQWYKTYELPIFYYHGLIYPANAQTSIQRLQSGTMELARAESANSNLRGTECILGSGKLGENGITAQFWFDSNRGYSLLRAEIYTAKGKLSHFLDITPKFVEWGWVPGEWKCTTLSAAGKMLQVVAFRVEECNINKSLDRVMFEGPTLEVGSIIKNRNTKDYYRVDANHQIVPFVPGFEQQGPRYTRIIWVGVSALMIAVVGVSLYLFRRQKKTTAGVDVKHT